MSQPALSTLVQASVDMLDSSAHRSASKTGRKGTPLPAPAPQAPEMTGEEKRRYKKARHAATRAAGKARITNVELDSNIAAWMVQDEKIDVP